MVELLAGPWGPLLIFALRIGDVSLATVRMVLSVRGERILPPLIGFVEIMIWILAVGAAVRNLNSPWHVMGYAGGFSAGTYVGLWVERKLAIGLASMQIVTRTDGDALAAALRAEGFGVTRWVGEGKDGSVVVLSSSLRRRALPRAMEVVDRVDPEAFVSIQDDRLLRRGWLMSRKRA